MANVKKEPESCIFCGGRPLSKEHFWPDWSAAYMPPSKMHTRGLTRGEVNAEDEVALRAWERDGHVGVITVRVVCEECNNGWMSQMEEAVRPILEPLLQNWDYCGVLTRESQDLLAIYFAMKVMVADHSIRENAVFSPDELKGMYESRTIPTDLTINIQYYLGGSEQVMHYNREHRVLRAEGVPLWQTPTMVNFTFRFGPMFIQALHRRNMGPLPMVEGDQRYFIRLHPGQNFSRSLPLRGRLVEDVALRFQHMLQAAHSGAPNSVDLVRKHPAPLVEPAKRR